MINANFWFITSDLSCSCLIQLNIFTCHYYLWFLLSKSSIISLDNADAYAKFKYLCDNLIYKKNKTNWSFVSFRRIHINFWSICINICNPSIIQTLSTDLYQFLTNLPAEYPRILSLHILDSRLDFRRGDSWFATTYHTGPYRSCFLITIQDLRHTPMRDSQLSRDHARSNPGCRHFYDF